jgi:hypothetical protein
MQAVPHHPPRSSGHSHLPRCLNEGPPSPGRTGGGSFIGDWHNGAPTDQIAARFPCASAGTEGSTSHRYAARELRADTASTAGGLSRRNVMLNLVKSYRLSSTTIRRTWGYRWGYPALHGTTNRVITVRYIPEMGPSSATIAKPDSQQLATPERPYLSRSG